MWSPVAPWACALRGRRPPSPCAWRQGLGAGQPGRGTPGVGHGELIARPVRVLWKPIRLRPLLVGKWSQSPRTRSYRPVPETQEHADAVGRILFARRNSLFSRSSSLIRCASAVVTPGRWPPSTSTYWTQLRSVSGLIPSCSPTRRNAPVLVVKPQIDRHPDRPLSKLLGMLPRCCHGSHPSLELEPPSDPARDTPRPPGNQPVGD